MSLIKYYSIRTAGYKFFLFISLNRTMGKSGAARQKKYRENDQEYKAREASRAKNNRKKRDYVESQKENSRRRLLEFRERQRQKKVVSLATPYSTNSSEARAFQLSILHLRKLFL